MCDMLNLNKFSFLKNKTRTEMCGFCFGLIKEYNQYMCGIIAGNTKRSVTPFLIQGLKQLEYRGYDSSGVGVLKDGTFQ